MPAFNRGLLARRLYFDGPTLRLYVKSKKNPNSRRDFLNRYIKS